MPISSREKRNKNMISNEMMNKERIFPYLQRYFSLGISNCEHQTTCKWTYHFLPTTSNLVWCYMLGRTANLVACCCAKFETGQIFSPVQTDATLSTNNSQHCWRNNMQQGAQSDATCIIQRCLELLANNVSSVFTGL